MEASNAHTRSLDTLLHEEVLYLTTVGRKTGEACTIEIWFVIYQRRIYLLAEHGVKVQWLHNIQANPEVTMQIERHRFRSRGRMLDDARDRQDWQAVAGLSRRKYGWGEGLPISFDACQAKGQETDERSGWPDGTDRPWWFNPMAGACQGIGWTVDRQDACTADAILWRRENLGKFRCSGEAADPPHRRG